MTERWKACVDFPDYEVSSLGRVKRTRDSAATNARAGRILKGWTGNDGYLRVGLYKDGKPHVFLVQRLIGAAFLDLKPDEEIIHRNYNKADNLNIGVSTRAQIAWNARGWKNASSRFKGVSWDKQNEKWFAHIYLDGRTKNLGRFAFECDAARAYDAAACQAWGTFAFLNFPDEAVS